MNVLEYIGLEELGVKISVVSVLVAVSDFLLKKFSAKIPKFIVNYLPLVIGLLGAFISELIASGKFRFTKEVFYSGLVAYSFGMVMSVGVRKLLCGDMLQNPLLMLVQGVAENICVKNAGAEYAEIVNILNNLETTDRATAKTDIISLLKKAAKDDVSDAEILAAAEMILLSAQNLIKEK